MRSSRILSVKPRRILTVLWCSLCLKRPAIGQVTIDSLPMDVCSACRDELSKNGGDWVSLTHSVQGSNIETQGGESTMDFRSLGSLLLLLGLVGLVVGYVVPIAVAVTLGFIGVVLGVVLIIVASVSGGSNRF